MSALFDFNGELASGDELIVDAETMEVSKNGSEDYADFAGDFLHLLAGNNEISFIDLNGGTAVSTFDDSLDGGNATSTYSDSIDGGTAVEPAIFVEVIRQDRHV